MAYRLGGWAADHDDLLDDRTSRGVFVPCGATEPLSIGYTAPRGKTHAPLVERLAGGHRLLALTVERRLLPGFVVKRRVDELARALEAETGRKPGARRKRELKEQATHELLPRAFTRRAAHAVWLDTARGHVFVDAASSSRADEIVTHLVQSLDGAFAVEPLHTALAPAAAMADWLSGGEPPSAFTVDRDCELKADDESRAAVRYARHRLDTDEVRGHIAAGKRPTRLALTWDGRVSFVLTAALQLRRIELLDAVLDGRPASTDADEGWDADGTIATAEIGRLLPELLNALGGLRPDPARTRPEAVPV